MPVLISLALLIKNHQELQAASLLDIRYIEKGLIFLFFAFDKHTLF